MCLPYHRNPCQNRVKWYRCGGQRTSRAGSLPKPTEATTGRRSQSEPDRGKDPRVKQSGPRPRMENPMKKTDKSRKWMWWFLAIVGAMQLYFVRELLAAFALFAAVFAVIATVVAGGYLLHRGWVFAIERVAASSHPLVSMVKSGADSVEDLARRPLRRPGSAAAAQ